MSCPVQESVGERSQVGKETLGSLTASSAPGDGASVALPDVSEVRRLVSLSDGAGATAANHDGIRPPAPLFASPPVRDFYLLMIAIG